MYKFGTWILNHLKIVVGITTAVVMLIVCGAVIGTSYLSYVKANKAYDENDLLVRSTVEAAPKKIAINDDFVSYKDDGAVKAKKSKLRNNMTAWAEELVADADVEGEGKLGSYVSNTATSVEYNLTVDATTFVDIDFVISSGYSNNDKFDTEDILDKVSFKVNNNKIEGGSITLKNEEGDVEFHHLVMTGFAIAEGDLKISVNAVSGKTAYMPFVRNISVFANANLAVAE